MHDTPLAFVCGTILSFSREGTTFEALRSRCGRVQRVEVLKATNKNRVDIGCADGELASSRTEECG